MQIHELNTGTPAPGNFLSGDTGSDTYKATVSNFVANSAPVFTSGDAASPTAWTDVATLTSGLSMSAVLARISTMIKNIRYLYKMLGNTNISAIGGGTVTGAISELNGKTSGAGTASNAYSSCTYRWQKRANIVTVWVAMTANTAISNSSGVLILNDIPAPNTRVYGVTADRNSLGTICGCTDITETKYCTFYGARTKDHVYETSFTYVTA